MTTKLDQLTSWLKERKITEMECLISDLIGTVHGRIPPINKFITEKGTRLSESVPLQTVTDDYVEDNIYCDLLDLVDTDMICRPDENAVPFAPWAAEPTTMMIHDTFDKFGNSVKLSLRNILKCVLKMYVDKGWQSIVVLKMGFYLIKHNDGPDYLLQAPMSRFEHQKTGRQSFSTDAANELNLLLEDMYDWCEVQGPDLDILTHEEGTAQMEVSFRYGDALDLADQILVFKRTMREATFKHSIAATLVTRPMIGGPGGAIHLYQNIVNMKTGKSIFSNADGTTSELLLHHISDLQKLILEVLPLFTPNTNSFRHFLSDTPAPMNVEWGEENHAISLRVLDSSPENRQVENRLVGVNANPYLALIASLLCGYIDMVEDIKPNAQVKGCGYGRRNLRLPLMIETTLECVENCKLLEQYLGSKPISGYVVMKRAERENFKWVISSWEREFLLLSA